MKKFIIIYIITFIGSMANLTSQERNVMWSHGLGGNGNTWARMEAIFDMERLMNGSTTGYDSFNGVAPATTQTVDNLQNNFGQIGSRDPKNIGIGHSMGGIVQRNVDATERGINQRFGGIITVGSPNDGIMLSNNLENGSVDRVITHACSAVMAGPFSEVPLVSIIIKTITPEVICRVLSDLLIEPLLGSQGGNPSARDMQVGSGMINNINANGSGIPQISIWGNERSPVHWRLLSSITSDNDNDTEWVNTAENFRSVYNSFYITHLSISISCGIIGVWVPPCLALSSINAFQATQWKRGVNWFDNSEGIWNKLMNCAGDEYENIEVTYEAYAPDIECACFAQGSWDYEMCEYYLCENHPTNCWVTVTDTRRVAINRRSDGFICEDAQIIDGIPQSNIYQADDANHSEEIEPYSEVQSKLREIFRDRPDGDFFRTNIR